MRIKNTHTHTRRISITVQRHVKRGKQLDMDAQRAKKKISEK